MMKCQPVSFILPLLSACTGGLSGPGQGGVNINICNLADTDGGCTQSGTNSNVSQTAIDGDAVDDATREAADLARDILGIEGAENPPPGGGTPPPGGGTPPPGGGGTQFPPIPFEAEVITPQAGTDDPPNPTLAGVTVHSIAGAGSWNIEENGPRSEYDQAPLLFLAGDLGTIFRWAPGGLSVGATGDNRNFWVDQHAAFPSAGIHGAPDEEDRNIYYGISATYWLLPVDGPPPDVLDASLVTAVGVSQVDNFSNLSEVDSVLAYAAGSRTPIDWENADPPAAGWGVLHGGASDLPALADATMRSVWSAAVPPSTSEATLQITVGDSGSNGSAIFIRIDASPPLNLDSQIEQTDVDSILLNHVHGHVQDDGLTTVVAVGKHVTSGEGKVVRLQGYNPLANALPEDDDWVDITPPESLHVDELTGVYVANSKAIMAVSVSGQIATCISDDSIPANDCTWSVTKPAGATNFTAIHGLWGRDAAVFYPFLTHHPASIYYPLYVVAVGEDGTIYRSTYFDQASQGAWTRITPTKLGTALAESVGQAGSASEIQEFAEAIAATNFSSTWTTFGVDSRGPLPRFFAESFVAGTESDINPRGTVYHLREELPLVGLLGEDDSLLTILLALFTGSSVEEGG